jgi:hypothetical protein
MQPTELKILDSDAASLKSVYVDRIERLLRLRREHDQELNSQGIRLLDRAIFAAYCACREAGLEDKAKSILFDANLPIGQLELPSTEELPRTGTDG